MSHPYTKKVIVALDVEGREKALALADNLSGSGCWLKVGMELYAYAGTEIIKELKKRGFSVFLDLKLHDIPTTVSRTVEALTMAGADMINVHCSGGYDMMARTKEAALNAGSKIGLIPKLIGVTVLTSMPEHQLRDELMVGEPLEKHVLRLAQLAQKAGLDGVVASAQESRTLRTNLGPDFLLVTPGIRPVWSQSDDQVRILTPGEAIKAGSSYLVVGRPVTKAVNPWEALERLWDEE